MHQRVFMVFVTMVLAIVALFLATQHPTGPNTVSFDEPIGLWISLGMLIALFLPPLILSFFNNIVVKIISAIYQAFIVITFLSLMPIGFLVPSFAIIAVGSLGAIASICSIFVTVLVGRNKTSSTSS